MAADALATQVAKASAGMVLTLLSLNIPISAFEVLIIHIVFLLLSRWQSPSIYLPSRLISLGRAATWDLHESLRCYLTQATGSNSHPIAMDFCWQWNTYRNTDERRPIYYWNYYEFWFQWHIDWYQIYSSRVVMNFGSNDTLIDIIFIGWSRIILLPSGTHLYRKRPQDNVFKTSKR